MRSTDLTVTSDGVTLRLATASNGRFRLFTEGADGPDWFATFGTEAVLVVADANTRGLQISFRPAPDRTPAEFDDLVLTAAVELGSTAGRDPRRVASIRLSGPADYPLDEYRGLTITPRADGSLRDEWRYLLPDGDGLWMRADGTGPGSRARLVFHEHRISLPMSALVDGSGAALMVSGVGGNDHAIDFCIGVDENDLSGMGLVNFASLGTWHHDREWRVASIPQGGVEVLADEMAAQLREQGVRLLTQTEKMTERGVPERLHDSVGGTVLWCHFDTLTRQIVDDLAAAELSSVMVMGRPADAAATRALAASLYAGGPYFQTYDVFPPGSVEELGWRGVYPPEGATTGWPGDLIHDREGWLNAGWRYLPFAEGEQFWSTEEYLDASGSVSRRSRAVHNATTVQTYRRCPARHRHVVEERGIPMLESLGATALFYDIATAMYALECYSPDHPVHRIEDIQHRLGILELLGEPGRLVHSEAGKWWGIDHVNTFEGLFSYDWEFNIGSIQLEDYPVNHARRGFEFNLEHRVPFFGMVARQSIARTMWWGTGQDRHSETWGSNNAITALFGANPIYIVDPDHPLTPGTDRWDTFIRATSSFDVLRRVAGDQNVVAYETDGPDLGRSVFEGGASVEANVGLAPAGGLAPGEYVVRDANGATVARVVHAAQ
ncbi:hypothetical protein [uncultured Microbacterium sp.]|uniref:hypothetical protein n=1 Tax=uncultured Microbacterium sp. TaxID=191216 RepID=UPI0035CB4995